MKNLKLVIILFVLTFANGCSKDDQSMPVSIDANGLTVVEKLTLDSILVSDQYKMLADVVGKTKLVISQADSASIDSGMAYTLYYVEKLVLKFPLLGDESNNPQLKNEVIESINNMPPLNLKINKGITVSVGFFSPYVPSPGYKDPFLPSFDIPANRTSPQQDWLDGENGFYPDPAMRLAIKVYKRDIGYYIIRELDGTINYEIGAATMPIDKSDFCDAIMEVDHQYFEGFRNTLSNNANNPEGISDDDPFMIWLRNKLREYFWLSQPNSVEEVQQMQVKRNTLFTQLSHWGYVNDAMKDGTKMLIPGVGAIADYYEGNYGSAATSAALDLFGASIIKAPLKVGLNLIRVSDLAARMPQIEKILNAARVVEIKVLQRGLTDQYAVIGETMHRVNVTSSISHKMFTYNTHTFTPSLDADEQWNALRRSGWLSEEQVKGSLIYQENLKWITDMKNAGHNIIDIGYDSFRDYRSAFYKMEKSVIYK